MAGPDERPTILVVDDQDAGRFVKVQTMRRAGFMVHEAATGRDALALAASAAPDVIILDVNLPDINGMDVCRQLRKTHTTVPALQILQISNTAITTADRLRGLEHGADVYLTEPVDAEILIATVRALLRTRRAEEALAVALERERAARTIAEEANRLKDEFLATLSHELRTPLNALMGWIWQLRYSTLDDDARERALDSLERNARVQAQLINDLLDLSRISKGKLHLRLQLVDLQAVVDGAVDSIKKSAEAKHLSVSVDVQPCVLIADQARLQQVLTNLLMNAVQFTPEHGAIFVTVTCDGGRVTLGVRDTGAGIGEAFLPFVFDQFRQGEGGLSRKHGGLGLGLSVVRQLVDLHGGTVTVTSPGVGQGTTFSVTFPIEPALQSAASLLLDRVKVLVVHPAAHDVADILEASGATTVAVTSTDAAAVALARESFEVIAWDRHFDAPPKNPARLVMLEPGLSASQLVRRVWAARKETSVER